MNGAQIKQIREGLGMTRTEFAAAIGTTATSVQRWEEKGTTPMPFFHRRIWELGQTLVKP